MLRTLLATLTALVASCGGGGDPPRALADLPAKTYAGTVSAVQIPYPYTIELVEGLEEKGRTGNLWVPGGGGEQKPYSFSIEKQPPDMISADVYLQKMNLDGKMQLQVVKSETLPDGGFVIVHLGGLGAGERTTVYYGQGILSCTALVRRADDVAAAERMCRSMKLESPPSAAP